MNDVSSKQTQSAHVPDALQPSSLLPDDAGPGRLLILGTQGWIPTSRRETTCLAFLRGRTLLIFDAGTGLSRFLESPAADYLAAADNVHMLLTHYHLDHSAGLSYISGLFPGRQVTVHVPAAAVNGVSPQDGVPQLIRSPFFPEAWEKQENVELRALQAGDNDVGGVQVRARAQCHADTTAGYRVEDLFALVTDTVEDPETARFAEGVQLLLHESWIEGGEADERERPELVRKVLTTHTSARQAAALAARARVGRLYLIHLNPLLGEDYYAAMERSAQTIFPATSVPADLQEHVFVDAASTASGRAD